MAGSALGGGAVVASAAAPGPATVHNATCVSGLSTHQLKHELMVTLQRDIARRYPRAARKRVFRKLSAHPALALPAGGTVVTDALSRNCLRSGQRAHQARQASAAHLADPGADSRVPLIDLCTDSGHCILDRDRLRSGRRPRQLAPGLVRRVHRVGAGLTKWSTGWFGSGVTVPVTPTSRSATPPQVSVTGGDLNLSAIAKTQTVGGKTFPYTSGMVTTMGKYTFTYGTIEARINLSGSNGKIDNWPAFWADGTGAWPATGELDVMEGLGGRAAYHFHSTCWRTGCVGVG